MKFTTVFKITVFYCLAKLLITLAIVAGIFLFASLSNGQEGQAIKATDAAFRVERFKCNRDLQTPYRDCRDYTARVAFELGVQIGKYGYWTNDVHTEAVASTVKTVGWEYELGIKPTKQIDLFWHHHSRHVMDDEQPIIYDPRDGSKFRAKFPVEDSFGIRIKLLGGD